MAVTFTSKDLVVDFKENAENGAERQYRIQYVCGSATVTHYVDQANYQSIDADTGLRNYSDTLTYAENAAAGLTRSPTIRLYTQNADGKWSATPTVVEANNPPSVLASSPVITPMFDGVSVQVDTPLDGDFEGFVAWLHTTSAVPLDDAHQCYKGKSGTFTVTLDDDATYYLCVAPYDAFGLELSSATTAQAIQRGDRTAAIMDAVPIAAIESSIDDLFDALGSAESAASHASAAAASQAVAEEAAANALAAQTLAETARSDADAILNDVEAIGVAVDADASAAALAASSANAAKLAAEAAEADAATILGQTNTARTQAETARADAIAAATTAGGHATTASTQATNAGTAANTATTAANSARSAAIRLLPDRPAVRDNFTPSRSTTATPENAAPVTTGSVVAVANEGDVYRDTASRLIATRGALEVGTGRTFKLTTRSAIVSGGSGYTRYVGFALYTAGFVYLTSVGGAFSASTSTSFIEINSQVTSTDILSAAPTAAYVRPYFEITGGTAPTWQLSQLSLKDITEVVAAASSASAAAGSATTASTQASNASTSASNAATSATNAAGSAATATTQATNAANSATSAGNSATAANTSATNAATSATAAGNSATAASSSAVTATSARDAAAIAAASTFPGDFAQDGALWTDQYTVQNARSVDGVAGYSFTTVSGVGRVAQMGLNYGLFQRAALALKPSRRYRWTVTARLLTAPTSGTVQFVAGYDYSLTSSYTYSGAGLTLHTGIRQAAITTGNGWVTRVIEFSTNASPPPFWRGLIQMTSNGTTDGAFQVSLAKLEDITESASAAGSASAAATSASNASTSATNAGNSATSAQNSATSANTSAGAASTSAGHASNSATNAAGSASDALTYSTNAANSAIGATAAATAASGSASSAATSATAAGSSASAAQTSATNAATSAGTASTQATNASNSATTAAGHASTASTQATAAANSATAAGNSASAASTSASNAATSATNAGNSATAAQTSATTATTAAGTAGTHATNAATSATNAGNSATAAATSATVSANSATQATQTAAILIPQDFTQDGTFFHALNFSTDTGSLAPITTAQAGATFPTVSGVGKVYQQVGSGTNGQLTTSKGMRLRAGATYQIQVTTRLSNASTNGDSYLFMGWSGRNSAGSAIASAWLQSGVITTAAGWVTWTGTVTTTAVLAANSTTTDIRPIALFNCDVSGSNGRNGTTQFSLVRITDVTESTAAAGSASAAATSASNASTSASTAAGHAATSSTQATNAANSATAAGNSATAASGSASTASTQATNAGASASAANTARLAAEAANGTAQSAATAASTSATTAGTHASTASTQAGLASTYATNAANSATTSTNQATIATNQATIATNAASAAQTSATISASLTLNALNKNAAFASYANSTNPDEYTATLGTGSTVTRVTGQVSPHAMRLDGAAGQGAYVVQTMGGSSDQRVSNGQWLVVEADLTLVSGALTGAGVIARALQSGGSSWQDLSLTFATDPDSTGTAPGTGTTGRRYSFSKLVQVTTAAVYLQLFIGAHMTNFGSIAGANSITFHKVAVRPATEREVHSKAVDTTITNLNASVSTIQGAIVDLEGRTEAYWQVSANAGTDNAVISARADGTGSVISMAARQLILSTSDGGVTKTAVRLVDGNAAFAGNIYAGGKIIMGNGNTGWDVAVKPKLFNVKDGDTVAWANLGYTPNYTISPVGLAPLSTGETYNLYLDSLTATGAVVRLKINVPGTPTSYNLTSSTGGGVGAPNIVMSKGSAADATNGVYRFAGYVSDNSPGVNETGSGVYSNHYGQITMWAKVGGTWTVIGVREYNEYVYQGFEPSLPGMTYNQYIYFDDFVTAPSGITDFGVSYVSYGGSIAGAGLDSVQWTAPGTASSIRTASPNNETSQLTVTP